MSKVTSPEAASAAARTLSDPDATPDAKSAAGSALSQAEPAVEVVRDTVTHETIGDVLQIRVTRVLGGKRVEAVGTLSTEAVAKGVGPDPSGLEHRLWRAVSEAWAVMLTLPEPIDGKAQPPLTPQRPRRR